MWTFPHKMANNSTIAASSSSKLPGRGSCTLTWISLRRWWYWHIASCYLCRNPVRLFLIVCLLNSVCSSTCSVISSRDSLSHSLCLISTWGILLWETELHMRQWSKWYCNVLVVIWKTGARPLFSLLSLPSLPQEVVWVWGCSSSDSDTRHPGRWGEELRPLPCLFWWQYLWGHCLWVELPLSYTLKKTLNRDFF